MSGLSAEDRAELGALAATYAAGVDRRDEVRFASAFAADAELHTYMPVTDEPAGVYEGRDSIATIPAKMIGRYDTTFHAVHQCTYTATATGATGEVYCTARHFGGTAAAGGSFVMYIRYADTYRRDETGRWLIVRREVHTDHTERTIDA